LVIVCRHLDAMSDWDVATSPDVVIPCTAFAVVQIQQNGPPGRRITNGRVTKVLHEREKGARRVIHL
jgi:hypothetical protein